MNYFEDHIGDYSSATAHLSWDEDMALTRLIRAYYKTERPIPIGQEVRIARAHTKAQKKAVASVITEFFTLEQDGYHQNRCDREIARYLDKRNKASVNAHARWNKPAPAIQVYSPGTAPTHQPPDTNLQSPGVTHIADPTHGIDMEAVCVALNAKGIDVTKSSHPLIAELIMAGAGINDLTDAALIARAKGKGLNYIIGIVRTRLQDAISSAPIGESGNRTPQNFETFRERDARNSRAKWEEMTGEVHPDNNLPIAKPSIAIEARQ